MKNRGFLRWAAPALAWAGLVVGGFAAGDASPIGGSASPTNADAIAPDVAQDPAPPARREYEALVDAMLRPPPAIDPEPIRITEEGMPILPAHRKLWNQARRRAFKLEPPMLEAMPAGEALRCFAAAYDRIAGGIEACDRFLDALGPDPTPDWEELAPHQITSLEADPATIKDAAVRKRYEAGQTYRRRRAEFEAWRSGLQSLQSHCLSAFVSSAREDAATPGGRALLAGKLQQSGMNKLSVETLLIAAEERYQLFSSTSGQ